MIGTRSHGPFLRDVGIGVLVGPRLVGLDALQEVFHELACLERAVDQLFEVRDLLVEQQLFDFVEVVHMVKAQVDVGLLGFFDGRVDLQDVVFQDV